MNRRNWSCIGPGAHAHSIRSRTSRCRAGFQCGSSSTSSFTSMLTPKWCRSSLSAGTSQTTAGGTCFTSGMASPGTTASLSSQPTSLSRTRCSSIRGPGAAINRWPFRWRSRRVRQGRGRIRRRSGRDRRPNDRVRAGPAPLRVPSTMGFPIVPQHVLGDSAEDDEVDATEFALTSPIGTGPFRLVAHVPEGDAELVLLGRLPANRLAHPAAPRRRGGPARLRTGRDRHHVHRRAGC